MTHRWSHRLEWWLVRALSVWLDVQEPGVSCRRAMTLGNLGRRVLRREWAWCQTNLRLIYGDHLSQKERFDLGVLAFRNIFMSYVEGLQPDGVRFTGISGTHHLLDAFQSGRGAILASIHLGGWESGLFHGARTLGLPLACLYRPTNNPLSEQFFQQRRSIYDIEWIPRDDVRAAIRALKRGKVLVVMTDINFRQGGVAVPFLGLPAMCPPGAGRLALQLKIPLVPVVVTRNAPGINHIHYQPPINLEELRSSNHPVEEATFQLNQVFARWIHEYADQYNWLHARWRSRPDGSLWRADGDWSQMAGARVEPFVPVSSRIRTLLTHKTSKENP
ncbi:MAG: lysophospholipid acyltransferase family protein [Magnetococcales bacterium]|nr:lysophospholipid acyltransferase family protein [Magnetococcales bacterium]MBF0347225.1 lysophospholipid acyltransferase family protein [Magnetococcales bacterium]